jgi:ribosome recycling factor
MDSEIGAQTRKKMDKVIEVVAEDMATVRAGGAKPSLVENMIVSVYGGQKMRLQELATIQAPDPTMITITPWDKSVIKDIEKAISDSELNLTAANVGQMLRIVIPPLTEERRADMVKLTRQKLESGKLMLRNIRQEQREAIESVKKESGVSEDDIKRFQEELDKTTNEYSEKLENMAAQKETELMKV